MNIFVDLFCRYDLTYESYSVFLIKEYQEKLEELLNLLGEDESQELLCNLLPEAHTLFSSEEHHIGVSDLKQLFCQQERVYYLVNHLTDLVKCFFFTFL